MPPLKAFENIDAGGVDSRSNPINMPHNRALRCLNWAPKQAGFWELRWGYTSVTMSTVSAVAITGMFPYRMWNGNKYVLFMQGTNFKVLNTGTGTVTTPTVLGTAIASSAKGNGYFANNRFHYGNGTDQKWFDGTSWRDNGIPGYTAAQVQTAGPFILEGVREFKPTEASTVTLTPGAGGSFPGDTTGRFIYVAIFNASLSHGGFNNGEIGPATIFVGPGQVVIGNTQKLTVANLPNLSFQSTWIKLIGGTSDGGTQAYFFTNTSTNINSCSRSTDTLTVSATGHGLSTGDPVVISGTGNFDGIYAVTVVDVNTLTIYLPSYNVNGNTGAVGTVKRIVNAGNAVTSVDVLAPTQDTTYLVNQNRGLPASTIGGPNAGYQFYISIYNPNGGGQIGNRIAIGQRFAQTGWRTNINIFGIPISGFQPEWAFVIGRTGDGGTTPYLCTDPAGNFAYLISSQTSTGIPQFAFRLTQGDISPLEMPSRNGVIPSQCTMFCVAADFCYAADPGSPYLRRSGDMSQAIERGNTVAGRPEQSWAPNDIDTFPTGEACTGIFEIDQEVFMGTLHDCALSVNLAGIQQWTGPWEVGLAGPRAATKCGSNGFFWLTGDKQLATFINGVPVIASDEYELAELSQIGSAFLGTVELNYYRNAAQNKDELRIEGQLPSGAPYTVIHDFKMREAYVAPGSIYGQGYSAQFLGPLATAFTIAKIRDGNGTLQTYAGASNGRIYQLYSGADDVGNQYTADLILLINGGPDRPNVPFVDYYGDPNVKITLGRNLSSSLAAGAQWGFDPPNSDANVSQAVPGAEQDFLFRVALVPSEVQRLYVRFLLTSHSGDGNLNMNSPIHIPLESYGRIYEMIPAIGDTRDR